jgi:hypothetical protein
MSCAEPKPTATAATFRWPLRLLRSSFGAGDRITRVVDTTYAVGVRGPLALPTSQQRADCVSPVVDTSYAVVGFGEAQPPRDLIFLVVFAGFAGKYHQKRIFLGGLQALQTPRLASTA